jgi:hypothetical protein
LVGYLFRYLARRAETARDPMDWAGEQLYALVAKKLEDDPALRSLPTRPAPGRERSRRSPSGEWRSRWRAAEALKAVLADCLQALSPDHTVTRGADRIFGYWYARARFA